MAFLLVATRFGTEVNMRNARIIRRVVDTPSIEIGSTKGVGTLTQPEIVESLTIEAPRSPLKVEVRGERDRRGIVLEFDSENCLADLLLDCWDAMTPKARTSVLAQMRNEAGQT